MGGKQTINGNRKREVILVVVVSRTECVYAWCIKQSSLTWTLLSFPHHSRFKGWVRCPSLEGIWTKNHLITFVVFYRIANNCLPNGCFILLSVLARTWSCHTRRVHVTTEPRVTPAQLRFRQTVGHREGEGKHLLRPLDQTWASSTHRTRHQPDKHCICIHRYSFRFII